MIIHSAYELIQTVLDVARLSLNKPMQKITDWLTFSENSHKCVRFCEGQEYVSLFRLLFGFPKHTVHR